MSDSVVTTSIIEPMKEWLATCDSRHAGTCVEPTTATTQLSSRPCRLIDVENQCIVRGDVQGQYLALSYVWHDDMGRTNHQQQFELTVENADFLTTPKSIKQYESQLPKAIQGAMELTRAIQNPALESPNDWFSTLRIDRDSRIKEYYGTVSRSRWAKRAWTYQEYILGKRVVFFLDTRIFWQCERTVWDKDYLRPKQDEEAESMVSSDSEPVRSLSVPAWPDFGLYADLICPYNGPDLSYSKDGLSACSGILNRLALACPNGFLFGLPRIYLDHALLWQPLKTHCENLESTVITDGCPGRISLSTRRCTLPSWARCGWQCFVDHRSFQAALNLGQDYYYRMDSTSSWKIRNIVTWEEAASSIQEPVKVDKYLQKLKSLTPGTAPIQRPSTNKPDSSTPSNHISALATHAFFFPAATLEIIFQSGWRRVKCAGLLSAFANPVLSEENLLEKPKVIVLRDPRGRFSGLLRITGNVDCKQGEPMELVAISRGSAKGRDLKDCFEERVFSLSRYRDAEPFWPEHDCEKRWIGVSYMTSLLGQCHYRVVATGEYETDLKVEGSMYEKDQHYEFYNVLWVQHGGDGIMYRAGCGRILTKCWEENKPTNRWITLG